MSNPIQHCLERLHLVDDTKLRQRAEQFQGQFTELPPKLFNKGGPNCQPVICIHLAYESLHHYDWNVELAAQLAGCNTKAYETVLSMVRKQLGIEPVVTFETLLVALGSTTMTRPVEELWKSFEADYVGHFKGTQQKINAKQELTSSRWKGAIVYCCAKALGSQQINKSKLYSLCFCTLTDLNKAIKVVQETSQEKMSSLKNTMSQQKSKSNNKRKTTSNDEPVAVTKKIKPVSGIVSMINLQDYQQTKRYKAYLVWKEDLIQQIKSSST